MIWIEAVVGHEAIAEKNVVWLRLPCFLVDLPEKEGR